MEINHVNTHKIILLAVVLISFLRLLAVGVD
jgi:hypothetical protein